MNMLSFAIIPGHPKARLTIMAAFEGIGIEHLARCRMNAPLSICLFTMELFPPDCQVTEVLVTYSKMRTWKEMRT